MKQKGQKTDEQKGQTEAGVATKKSDMAKAGQISAVILAVNETVNAKLVE